MIQIGKLLIKNQDAVIEARNKIMSLAESLCFNEIKSARLASIASEVCHSGNGIISSKVEIEVGIISEMLLSMMVIKFQNCENIYFPSFEGFFDKIIKEKTGNDGFRLTAMINLPDVHPELTEEFIDEQSRLFKIPSKTELLNILKEKNKELESESKKLLLAKKEAEEANKAKSEFLANMSHEIRTPMNAILGFAEILSNKIKEHEQKNYLSIILSSGNGLLTIINDILDLSKIEAGKLELQPSFVHLGRIMIEIKQMFTKKVEDKCIDFLVDISDNFPQGVFLDPVRIRQIIMNLTGNSIKFTEKGYVRITAHHSYIEEPKNEQTLPIDNSLDGINSPQSERLCNVVITVEDTGIGIPADQIDKIFKPFEQVAGQSTKKFGGTGLGLSISTKLVKLMNGSIGATSEFKKGTIFTIKFQNVACKEKINADNEEDKQHELDIKFNPAKVLLIDDVETNRLIINAYLKDYGLSIVEALNPADARDKLKNEQFSLIITGMKMRGMNGEELSKEFKHRDDTRNIPIIMISASAQKEDEEKVKEYVDSFLLLPVEKVQLIKAMKKYLPYAVVLSETTVDSESKKETGDLIEAKILTTEESENFENILNKYEKEWISLNKSRQITAVKDFASRLQETARTYGSEQLWAFAFELAQMANSLQVTKIKNHLNQFPVLVNKIKEK